MSNEEKESKYLQYLPSLYRAEPEPTFLGRFLKAFEEIFSGLEGKLDNIPDYFDPEEIGYDHLQWLAGWLALTLREEEDWDEKKKRNLISRIVPLYKKRGTREGLEEYIKIYVGDDVPISINELLNPTQVRLSQVGINTMVGDGPAHYFQIDLELPVPDLELLQKKRRAIKEIVDLEKPAHTHYDLVIRIPTMQIQEYSTVGVDTLLGGIISD